MRIRGDAKTNDRNRRVAFQTRIDTCVPRTVNKAPLISGSGHTDIWSVLSRICPRNGERHGALPRRDNKGGKSPVRVALDDFGDRQRDSALPASTICSTGLRAHSVRPHRYAHYGVASYRCSAHGFHPRETLPSAARPCCGRRSCPVSRCPVFGYGTNCSLTVRKPIRSWAPSPSFSLPFSFVRDCSPRARPLRFLDWIPGRHINYPANGRSFGII